MQGLPIGIDDFAKVREGDYYFVDKSMAIRDFLDNHGEVLLLTRPRRFGKTLFLSMFYYFFAAEQGKEHRQLFRGLAIERAGEQYMAEQGRRPALFLTLKDVKHRSWADMLAKFRFLLSDLYDKYAYLLESTSFSRAERRYFQRIHDGEASPVEMEEALRRLMDMMKRYHHQPVVLLLDEYDIPVQQAWEHGFYEDCMAFMRNFLSAALKTNPALDFAVLTGVLRIAKESIFSGLNNLEVSSVINGTYADWVGFTPEEVRALAQAQQQAATLPVLHDWYDGYRFGEQEIYNPWSVLCFFKEHGQPQPYWAHTSGNALLGELLRQTDTVQEDNLLHLIQGQTVTAVLTENTIYPELADNPDALYTILLLTGYLKIVSRRLVIDTWIYVLAIPNREVRSIYRNEILNRLSPGRTTSYLMTTMESLMAGNAQAFARGLQDILTKVASVYDTANREAFYHGLLLGMTTLLVPEYEVKSNRESGLGRYDLAIYPTREGQCGVILEFKAADTPEELTRKAQEARRQIDEKGYDADFRARGIHDVLKYGIAFCGKQVVLV
ncbi:AAA family ATPase [Mitsuokella jalaludinii]|uniref:AAA family ATPase n=1 Tax=Mitsuokella jalaludinii TaxID=187979 RepID=UPI003F9A0698